MKPKLGVENGQLTQCPNKPNCVNSFAKDKKHLVEPILFEGSKADVKSAVILVLNKINNADIVETKDDYVRATFTSKVFGFVDDVEFYFPNSTAKKTSIHVRSASRVGYFDFDVNRKRIDMLRIQLTTRVKKIYIGDDRTGDKT